MQETTASAKGKKQATKTADIRLIIPIRYYAKIKSIASRKGIPARTMAKMMLIEYLEKSEE